ncbi:hypothetical protein OQY15_16845 [Pedobacter sp. MC2016-15]|uniref:hypothetical protein n=1 Tax=Pedobacter sp. MC2016-15 TaxID=2994473 RepID=UPI0022479C2C|nr:hypothetical protein [Pedobacter sp. MC2016-15]MCX2480775.1 hypothetical protein [Pedobacter sp. MC2016-15]
MFEYIKQRILKKLIEEIECISPTNLELVGHYMVSIIENKKMIHHGLNKDYKSSGYTVDSFTSDSLTIAEYSTDKSYFENKAKKSDTIPFFEKITNDIQHAIAHNIEKKPHRIYLLSSEVEPPSFRAEFNKTEIAQKNSNIVMLYDARELAKYIYEQSIKSIDDASFYKQFFPDFSQNLDNYEYYGRVPCFCDIHITHEHAIDEIKNHLTKLNIAVISGISGSGKTQLVIDFIHHEKRDFENYIWIMGEDWKKDTSLSSIQRTRGGAPINIPGLFNASKTILVIDSLERTFSSIDLSELNVGFSKGGKVIITSQLSKNDEMYLPIPEISDDIALQIIGEIKGEESSVCMDVIKLCKPLPLILSTIRNLVREEEISREELYREVLDYPNDLSDNGGMSIMGAILGKLEPKSLKALKKIANSGSTIHDSDFLSHYIGTIGRTNLQRLSLLLAAGVPSCLKIHDLVCASVQDNLNTIEISESIEDYISRQDASMSPSVMRQIHLCYQMLMREYRARDKNNPSWVTYALLQIESGVRNEIQEELYNKPILPTIDLAATRCLVDSREAHAYSFDDNEKRNNYFKACAKEYTDVINTIQNDKIKIEILHHLGKVLRRTDSPHESIDSFLKVLTIDPNLHATFLQIAHVGTLYGISKEIKELGEHYLEKLINAVIEDYTTVPLRVSLGAFARLRTYKKLSKKINGNKEQVRKLANVIAVSLFEGFGQFFEAFVSFTSVFNYRHGSECLSLIEELPVLLTITPESIDEENWLNACEGLTNLAISASREGKNDLSKKIALTSIPFADKIFEKGKFKSFNGRALIKAYSTADMDDKALIVAEKVPVELHDHWFLYQKSKAQLKSKVSDSYNSAKTALELAEKDSYAKDMLSIYHDLISQCALMNGMKEEARNHANLALDKCLDDKYKIDLSNRLEEISKLYIF